MAKFLVIEDDLYTITGVRQVLESRGHDVAVAEDGATLADLLGQHQPEVLLVAPRMIDETQMASLRSGEMGLPVVFLVTRAESGLVAPQIDRFVYTSPLDVTALHNALNDLFPSEAPVTPPPVEAQPEDPTVTAQHADSLAQQGKRTEAAAETLRAADLYLKQKNLPKAIACLEAAIRIMPSKEIYLRLAETYELADDKSKAVENYLRLAQMFQQDRAIERALYSLRRALRIDPRNPQILDVMRGLQSGGELRPHPDDTASGYGAEPTTEDDSAATVILSKPGAAAVEDEAALLEDTLAADETADLDELFEEPEPSPDWQGEAGEQDKKQKAGDIDTPAFGQSDPAPDVERQLSDWQRNQPQKPSPPHEDPAEKKERERQADDRLSRELPQPIPASPSVSMPPPPPAPPQPRPASPIAPAPAPETLLPSQPPAPTETGTVAAAAPGGGEPYRDHIPKMDETGKSGSAVQFAAYYPKEVTPDEWKPLTAYVYKAEFAAQIAQDAKNMFGSILKQMRRVGEGARQQVEEGALIVATPNIPGFQCNPPSLSVYFYEDWQRFDFKLRAKEAPLNEAANGRLTFSVEGVIVADVPLAIFVGAAVLEEEDTVSVTHDPYQAIFCSYSHKDKKIVERVERAYKALGLDYLRDVYALKSGQEWDDQLLKLIDEADIFQLFWSSSAASSPYVKQEYEHALKRHKGGLNFIRPVYWEEPIPEVPPELGHLHFAYQPELDD